LIKLLLHDCTLDEILHFNIFPGLLVFTGKIQYCFVVNKKLLKYVLVFICATMDSRHISFVNFNFSAPFEQSSSLWLMLLNFFSPTIPISPISWKN